MGFPGYFLIVADFIQWAKNNGVPVGPGGFRRRSLVAYARITDIDPCATTAAAVRALPQPRAGVDARLRHRLLPGQPLDRVIEYVRERYGAHAVSQIATFGTMASKAVIRDVGRVLDLPYGLCDRSPS